MKNSMTTKSSLIEFPCDFQIKIIGKNSDSFYDEIAEIARKHHSDFNDSLTKSQRSEQGNYLAITITVHAHNQGSLDALYRELTQHPDVKMVL
jgi:putative lipoic acid-binding regulatory protein